MSSVARSVSMVGAIASAVAASACCIGPLMFASLGVGGAGLLVAFEPYRPFFTLATLGLLAIGFYQTYGHPSARDIDDCGCEMPRARVAGRRLLWVATALAAIALGFPYLVPYLF